jgi:sirohydrochlorin ferrochelatase
MTGPALVAVAHGSRDPRSARTVRELVAAVRELDPSLDVRVAFLDLCGPLLTDVLAELTDAVVVPLLLGAAFHSTVDIPGELARVAPASRVAVSTVLGPDARLEALALRRLTEAGADLDDPELGIVLVGAGSTHDHANDAVRRIGAGWAARHPIACATTAFAGGVRPGVHGALAASRARGARRIAVGSWFLAPGRLPDRVRGQALSAAPDAVIACPLGADRTVAEVVIDRYATVAAGMCRAS